ncbi:camphor resistance [Legionella lansingensis]|uniref:Fluoride-specific ion channel FluC n=1 Tax=Legionella lansingensis TaxID=45067 RepID=A0A0W0VUM1_9GAMM|nr:fluoride efflux transporter CrcB [Legionella lansingensis]KTD23827.1 camphor resistance protein CrcB [Legionella lansingensis]SNV46816.1 camphor resistance [Legionella lansingensis]
MLGSILVIIAGGAMGALARFATVGLMQRLLGFSYPYGTLVVNCLGSFLAGFIMVLIIERFAETEYWRLFLVVGFLGAYTTFSSFSWETWVLYQDGKTVAALANVFCNNVGALVMAFIGMHCGRFIGTLV